MIPFLDSYQLIQNGVINYIPNMLLTVLRVEYNLGNIVSRFLLTPLTCL